MRLVALGETWPIAYRQDEARAGIWLWTENGNLVLTASALDREALIRKLKEWLRLRVRGSLSHPPKKLADEHGCKCAAS